MIDLTHQDSGAFQQSTWPTRGVYIVLSFSLLLGWSVSLAEGQTTTISCFILGKVHPALCPLTGYFEEDPMFRYSLEPIPSGLTDPERQKYDRLYYPRSRKILLETYDMLFFSDARIQHFIARQFHDLDFAFREAGMPSLWSFGPAYGQAIEGSILSEILPISDHNGHYHKPWRVVFRREREPIFLPFIDLGMEKVTGDGFAWMTPRPGAVTWADMQPLDTPFLVSWRPGGGSAGLEWVCGDEYNVQWWGLSSGSRGSNPYAIDLVTNLVLYSVGRPLISDIHTRREARRLLSTFKSQKLLVLSMMEWADNFGANIFTLSNRLTELEQKVEDAMDCYVEQEYPASITLMGATASDITEITEDAVALKDEALVWVFLVEWMTVTSAGIITGIVVWSLMIQRKMYRTAGSTKLRLTH